MHQNYYFLRHLTRELNEKLSGLRLAMCFSQNKNELVLGFTDRTADFFIKADLSNQQGILSFPTNHKRARKNSIDLFDSLVDREVLKVLVHQNERSFQLSFSDGHSLVFKLFGRQSNILHYDGSHAPVLFKTRATKDHEKELEDFDRQIDQSWQHFQETSGDLKSIFPTFGMLISDYLELHGYHNKTLEGKWEMIESLMSHLEQPCFYLVDYKDRIRLSMVEVGTVLADYSTAIDALNDFASRYSKASALKRERTTIIKDLEQKITRYGNYVIKTQSKLKELAAKHPEQLGDILMANLHQVKPGSKEVKLHDFYNDQTVNIKLNPRLTIQKNAERYYNKSKNQGIEIKKLKESMLAKKQALEECENLLKEVEVIDDLKRLRQYNKKGNVKATIDKELPYHDFIVDGYHVWVGKNARANDRLTLQYAHKDDLWFHARDVAGSHVVLKNQPGRGFPLSTIEKVAQVAAWYSKGKNFPLCPVVHTLKKFVRKPKGFAPGMVKLDREEVILVEPKAPSKA